MWFPKDEASDNSAPIVFTSKGMTSVKTHYSNIESKVLGILHGLEKFHYYCFTYEVCIITDNKPLVSIFKKGKVTLSHRLQRILLLTPPCNIRIM